MQIEDLLAGKPLTKANLYNLQKDPRASGMRREYDPEYSLCVENALRALNSAPDPKIPKAESKALQMSEDDELSFEFICRAKQDPRYLDSSRRDKFYVRAVDQAVKELAAATEKQIESDQNK